MAEERWADRAPSSCAVPRSKLRDVGGAALAWSEAGVSGRAGVSNRGL